MPRVEKERTGQPDIKPYQRPLSFSDSEEVKTPSPPRAKHGKAGAGAGAGRAKAPGPAKGGVYEYNRPLILALVLKTAKPDWGAIGATLGKSSSQCFDVWRKIILPALHAGKPWAATTAAWTATEKVQLVDRVLKTTNVDWDDLASTFPDRTKAQIYDVWRKGIQPKLRAGSVVA